ncbi:MAG: ABC transporter substrate-binding protein [Halobacteriales archaeon]|nr:ABC transporter substrate-binding protein [Halobacteriales archaeon]
MRTGALVASLLLLALALAGCASKGPTASANEVVFTTANIGDPESLDPAYDYEQNGGAVLQNVYDTLVYYNRASATDLVPTITTAVPSLENGGISEDGLTYTFHLKPGVRFSDGTPLSAADVKFSFDRVVLMNGPNSPAWIDGVIAGAEAYGTTPGTAQDRAAYVAEGGVQVLDPSTVQFRLSKPDAAFLYKIAYTQGSIVSSKAFKAPHPERQESWGVASTSDGLPPPASGGRRAVTRDPWADRNAVGTGPFKLDRWVPGDKVILRKNPYYSGSPKPQVDVVVLQKVVDLNTRILMLQNKEADDIYVSPSDVVQVQGKSFARVIEQPSFVIVTGIFTRHVTNTQECPVDAVSQQADCDFFSDVNMRKAFALSFDYQKFVDDVTHNHAIQLTSVVPKGMFGYADLRGTQYDPRQAQAALQASHHPGGFKLNVYYNAGNALREGAAQLLKSGLEALSPSIKVNVQPLDWATALLPGGKKSGFAMYFIGWSPDYAFPDDYVKPFADDRAGQYAAWAKYDDAELKAMIDDALATVDQGQLEQKYAAIQQHMTQNYDYLYLAQQTNPHVEGPWVRGYFYNPMDSNQPLVGHYQYMSKVRS